MTRFPGGRTLLFVALVLLFILALGSATIRLTGKGPEKAEYRYGTRSFVPGSSAHATKRVRSMGNVLNVLWSRLYLGYNQMAHQDSVRPYDSAFLSAPRDSVPVSGTPVSKALQEHELAELEKPLAHEAGSIEQGKRAYRIGCFPCHGQNFDGWAPVGESYAPAPSDLHSDRVQHRSDAELFRIISDGSSLGFCPPQRSTLTLTQRWAVVTLLRHLPPKSRIPPDMPLASPSASALLTEGRGAGRYSLREEE